MATIGDVLLSPLSGGSDGTTVRVFRQFGHMKQFRAHLVHWFRMHLWYIMDDECAPILLRAHTCAGDFEEAVRAVVATDFNQHAAIAPHRIALFAKEQVVKRLEAIR